MVDYGSTLMVALEKMVFWTILFLCFVAVCLVVFAVYYFLTFKHRAVIYDSERKQAAKLCRFKILYNRGIIKFFKTKPNKMLIPNADCFVPHKRNASFLCVEQNGEFFMPLRVSPNPGFVNAVGDFNAIKLWHIQDVKETETVYAKKQSFWVQMAPFFALMFVGVILLVIAILMFKDGGGGGSPVAAAAQVIPGI